MASLVNSIRRVAIVTGAAQGIGRAIALRLADDGLDVALNDIAAKKAELQDVASLIKAKGRQALSVTADVSAEAEVEALVGRVAEELGSVDVMVANAGIASIGSLIQTTTKDWDHLMGIDARGVMLSYKYAALQMIKQGKGGRIIGASSTAGRRAFPNLCAYSAAKFLVRGLTQSAALELAEHGIAVNAYAPGVIRTPLVQHPGDTANGGEASTFKKIIGAPDAPDAGPEEVAGLVSYLIRPESHFITGQTIMLNGGVVMD